MNLQVGTQDGQQLAVDLGKTSFSSTALGLEDFTIYGIEGEITPRDTLRGRAHDIVLKPSEGAEVTTKLSMYVNGALQDNATTEYVRGLGADGSRSDTFAGRYIQTQDSSGKLQYYYYSTESATLYTETNHNDVTLSANSPVFSETSTIALPTSSQQSFQLSDGTSFAPGASPELVSADGLYYIKSQEEGFTVYREAEVAVTSNGTNSSLTKAKDSTVYTHAIFLAVQPEDTITVNVNGTPTSSTYDTYSSANFTDSPGTAFRSGTQSLVSYNGDYYIQHTDGGTTQYFEAALSSTDGTTFLCKP